MKPKKETGSRRYPFRNQTLAGAKHRAKFMGKEICCVVHEDDRNHLLRPHTLNASPAMLTDAERIEDLKRLIARAHTCISAIERRDMRDMSAEERQSFIREHGPTSFVIGEFAVRKLTDHYEPEDANPASNHPGLW